MLVRITKKGKRNQLACVRTDGASVVADLGPSLPHHDLAHFVVEREFLLKHGFFGNIALGYSPAQLSDKETIRSLGAEPYRAEILARALGSLVTGACAIDQFEELVNLELSAMSLTAMQISRGVREQMLAEFRSLLNQYRKLGDGESLCLQFDVDSGDRSIVTSREQ